MRHVKLWMGVDFYEEGLADLIGAAYDDVRWRVARLERE
jgi:hypothetical protein